MAVSLRTVCGCIGLTGNISIMSDFFGYRRFVKPTTDSLLTQVKILSEGAHINMNIIIVGSNMYMDPDLAEIEYAIRKMRSIYAQVNIGIGRIEYNYPITTQEAPGRKYK